MRNSILRHPNAVRSKNVATKRCTVVHKARYVFPLDDVRINYFRVHNLLKSRDILTDPIMIIILYSANPFKMSTSNTIDLYHYN